MRLVTVSNATVCGVCHNLPEERNPQIVTGEAGVDNSTNGLSRISAKYPAGRSDELVR